MAFDPNQPFTVIEEPKVGGFDPNQAFKVVSAEDIDKPIAQPV